MGRPTIPISIKRKVLIEAGHRCAIPTCRATTTEIAHIVAYSVVKEHRFENLIALCPNCHTRYDKGEIDKAAMLKYKSQLNGINLNPLINPGQAFKITLWLQYEEDKILFHVENNSDEPLLDFILYVDKIYKTELDQLKSPHTLEILYGTIPARNTLTHKDSNSYFTNDVFGFPLLTGQFSDRSGRHWSIDREFNVTEISFRAPFD